MIPRTATLSTDWSTTIGADDVGDDQHLEAEQGSPGPGSCADRRRRLRRRARLTSETSEGAESSDDQDGRPDAFDDVDHVGEELAVGHRLNATEQVDADRRFRARAFARLTRFLADSQDRRRCLRGDQIQCGRRPLRPGIVAGVLAATLVSSACASNDAPAPKASVTTAPTTSAAASATTATVAPAVVAAGTTRDLTTTTPGRTDAYRGLYVPASLPDDAPVPLLVALHGGTGSGRQFERQSDFDGLAVGEPLPRRVPRRRRLGPRRGPATHVERRRVLRCGGEASPSTT